MIINYGSTTGTRIGGMVTLAVLDSLADLSTYDSPNRNLPSGVMVFIRGNSPTGPDTLYILDRDSTAAPSSPDVIAANPASGGGNWLKFATAGGASSSPSAFLTPFAFDTASPLVLPPDPFTEGSATMRITVLTTEVFDGAGPTIIVGTSADDDKFFALGDIDLTTLNQWDTDQLYVATALDLNIIATISAVGATQGSGYILTEVLIAGV